ncbi:MAG: nuclear transport factor 2 family protein [Pseudomonadota bacterium]
MGKTSAIDPQAATAIRHVALDYVQGWYSANAARMDRALHQNFAKRTVVRSPDGAQWTTGPTSEKKMMVDWTREGGGSAWAGELEYDIEILDVFRDIASVRCVSPEYVDHLQLAYFGEDGWQIVNVLWQLREGDYDPTLT